MSTRTQDILLFLGDIRGTKSGLRDIHGTGGDHLQARIEHLHDRFVSCFIKYAPRSRSLYGITLSDSILAHWTDPAEGFRIAQGFMVELWSTLNHSLVSFRGFLDHGPAIKHTSILSQVAEKATDRLYRAVPTGIAIWSVSVAEAAHFPPGMYVGSTIANRLLGATYEVESYTAEEFTFKKLRLG